MILTPDFYVYHRHLLLCLSHIAAALTVGMISATGGDRQDKHSHLVRVHRGAECSANSHAMDAIIRPQHTISHGA